MSKRWVLIALAGLLALAVAAPVRASDQGELSIGPGRTWSGEFPGLLPMPLADVSWDPNSCISTPWCDRFLLKVRLPAQPEEHRLTVKLDWLGGPQLSAMNYCYLYVWDQPQGSGPVREAACVDEVASVDFVPIKGEYQVVVRNFTATESTGYRLTLAYE